ncbi:MAG TPA: RecX family transcriptional regulator [bacterium]|nr:RecX family transcriptional regulator [bacterium]
MQEKIFHHFFASFAAFTFFGTMKITKIEQQQKNKQRYSVYLDGEFAFGIHQSILLKAGLHTGEELTPDNIADFEKQDALFRAKDASFRLLKYRQRSEAELRKRLLQKSFDEEIVEAIITELTQKDYLNDEEFARLYSEDLLTRKHIGPLRMRAELSKKQVPEEIIERTIQTMYQKYDEYDLARKAAEKKLRTLTRVDNETAHRRVTNYLVRRGFDWDIIAEVVDIDPTE